MEFPQVLASTYIHTYAVGHSLWPGQTINFPAMRGGPGFRNEVK